MYRKPSLRVGLLLREKFITQEALGHKYVAIMHEPIVADGNPFVLELYRYDDEDYVNGWYADDEGQWPRGDLFVFLAP